MTDSLTKLLEQSLTYKETTNTSEKVPPGEEGDFRYVTDTGVIIIYIQNEWLMITLNDEQLKNAIKNTYPDKTEEELLNSFNEVREDEERTSKWLDECD